MQVRVVICGEVPKVTLAGVPQVSPAGVDAETVKDAVPLPVAVTVIIEVPVPPGKICAGLTAPAVTEVIVNPAAPETGTLTVRVSVPLVPVIVTVKLCAVEQPAVRVAVFGVGRVTDDGAIVAVQPDGVVDVIASPIDPVKPFCALAVIVEVPVLPAVKLMLAGLEVRVKSTTWNVMIAVACVIVTPPTLLVPVTVTV